MSGNNQYPMHCRYEAGHGSFSNGRKLRQHYDDMHPGHLDNPRGTCSACKASLMYRSFGNHKRGFHSRDDTAQFIEDKIQPKLLPAAPKAVAVVPAPTAPLESVRQSQKHAAANPTLFGNSAMFRTVDDLVLPAIEAMALPGNMVPIAALGALLKWRDATAVMLQEVSGK